MAENSGSQNNNFQREFLWRANSQSGMSSDEDDSFSQYKNRKDQSALDFSHMDLDSATLLENIAAFTASPESARSSGESHIRYLYLQYNRLEFLPDSVNKFLILRHLDLSNNQLTEINDTIFYLKELTTLILRNNFLGDFSFPKKLSLLHNLQELNLSGNLIKIVPPEIIDLKNLRALYLGGNAIEEIPCDVWKLEKLEILYLGGNNLKEIPAEMGRLHCLKSLVLCENQLQSLPSTISCLRRLRSLLLHKNQLTTLPPEIVTLRGLVELSLRDNPLVVRFVQDLTYDPPTLQELSARCIKIYHIPYNENEIPRTLTHYLQSACRCVNPNCRGVYFDVRVEYIKFVDFCGKYRIPLLQYLCSPRCSVQPAFNASDTNSSDDDCDVPRSRINRVLLG